MGAAARVSECRPSRAGLRVSSQPSGPGFETTAERKRHRRQLTEDGNVETRGGPALSADSRRSPGLPQTAAIGKGFGCRPGASDRPGIGAGVGKPPMNEPAGRR